MPEKISEIRIAPTPVIGSFGSGSLVKGATSYKRVDYWFL